MRRAVAVLLVISLAGCSVGDIRRTPPVPASPAATPSTPAPATAAPMKSRGADEVRRTRFDLGATFTPHTVEFADQRTGYAMFIGCDQAGPQPAEGCPAALFGTGDGGRTWQEIRHPHRLAKNHQMYVGGGKLILLAEPHGWWVSADRGRTFTHQPAEDTTPSFYHEAFGRYQACCDADQTRKVVEFTAGKMRPVPTQPPIPSVDTVGSGRDLLYAAGLKDGRPYAAVSADRGRTWKPTALAADADLDMLQIMVSYGGEHAWLVGNTSRFAFPRLWLYDGQGWRPSGTEGHPLEYLSAAALDDGSVAITGPAGAGVVLGGAYRELDWPVGRGWVTVLADGTVFSQVDRDTWLGVGTGTERRWIRIELSAR
jgi:hypothetical protein